MTDVLAACDRPLAQVYDVALMDLDGVVYRGAGAVPHAADAIASAGTSGMRTIYVTNNALRPPAAVAKRLSALGVPAGPSDVVTSAQAAARMLSGRFGPGAAVLVLGGAGLLEAVLDAGLRPVESASDEPAAVVQGFDPTLTYDRLAEGAFAVRAGALWVASNTDATVPTERGLAPGNGSLVALIRTATGAEPLVAGKPERALHEESVRRSGARHPLVVGDRLDTDIESATRSGTPSLLVMTGVTSAADLLRAGAVHRPTYVAADLRGLLRAQAGVTGSAPGGAAGGPAAVCGAWTCRVSDGVLGWERRASGPYAGPSAVAEDGLDALRAACGAAWAAADRGSPVVRIAADRPPGCESL